MNDALKLVNLQRGAALLLQEMLKSKGNKDSKTALSEMGIVSISPHLANNILNKRIFS